MLGASTVGSAQATPPVSKKLVVAGVGSTLKAGSIAANRSS